MYIKNKIEICCSKFGLNLLSITLQFIFFSSDRMVDDQISIAVETRDHLVSQRLTFKRLQTRMHDLSSRFPVVNSLLQRINIRKRRDSLILGLVVGICTILLLLYAFH